jgi:peroxiredoxin
MAAEAFSIDGPGGVRIVADRLGDPQARAVVFLHGGGQTRRSWGKAAAAVAKRGWQSVTIDLRGHGESDWSSEGDYRVVSFAADVQEVLRTLPAEPVLVGASLGGFTSMLLAGEISPGIASAVVLVDIVPNMEQSGATRIHNFMADRVKSGFASLDEVADPPTWKASPPTCAAAGIGGTGTGTPSSSAAPRRILRLRSPTLIACTPPLRRSCAAECPCCWFGAR